MSVVVLFDIDYLVYRIGFAAQQTEWVLHDKQSDQLIGPLRTIAARDARRAELAEWDEFTRIQPGEESHAYHSVNMHIDGAMTRIAAKLGVADPDDLDAELYLTGAGNYRELVATIKPYKGNRKAPKPLLYDALRDYLIEAHGAVVINGREADDAVSIRQTEIAAAGGESVIAGIDKDLLQVPGWHYNPDKGMKRVSEVGGLRSFYRQLLTGDRTDNIPGVHRIGDAAAAKLLPEHLTDEADLWAVALMEYVNAKNKYGAAVVGYDDPRASAVENARLLWMQRSWDEPLWLPPGDR